MGGEGITFVRLSLAALPTEKGGRSLLLLPPYRGRPLVGA